MLHELIHARLFVDGRWRRDHELAPNSQGHGPIFCSIAEAINRSTVPDPARPAGGYNITVYHTMLAEVDHHRAHRWACRKCGALVKRAMNRPPQRADCAVTHGNAARGAYPCSDSRCLHCVHVRTCGGEFEKIAEPPGFAEKQAKKQKSKERKEAKEKAGGDKAKGASPAKAKGASPTKGAFKGKGHVLGGGDGSGASGSGASGSGSGSGGRASGSGSGGGGSGGARPIADLFERAAAKRL